MDQEETHLVPATTAHVAFDAPVAQPIQVLEDPVLNNHGRKQISGALQVMAERWARDKRREEEGRRAHLVPEPTVRPSGIGCLQPRPAVSDAFAGKEKKRKWRERTMALTAAARATPARPPADNAFASIDAIAAPPTLPRIQLVRRRWIQSAQGKPLRRVGIAQVGSRAPACARFDALPPRAGRPSRGNSVFETDDIDMALHHFDQERRQIDPRHRAALSKRRCPRSRQGRDNAVPRSRRRALDRTPGCNPPHANNFPTLTFAGQEVDTQKVTTF